MSHSQAQSPRWLSGSHKHDRIQSAIYSPTHCHSHLDSWSIWWFVRECQWHLHSWDPPSISHIGNVFLLKCLQYMKLHEMGFLNIWYNYINYCKFFLKFPSYLPLARRCISWFIFSSNSSKIVLPLVSISQKVKTRTPTWRYFAILVPIFLIMNNENGLVAKNFKSMNENMTWKHRYNLFSDFS